MKAFEQVFTFSKIGISIVDEEYSTTDSVQLNRKRKVNIIFFSFFNLEYGGGFEHGFMEVASDLMHFSDEIKVTVITATPELTKRLQYFSAIFFFKKPDANNIYRESSLNIKKKLGKARYVQFKKLSLLLKTLDDGDVIYVKNEILELLIIKMLNIKIKKPVIIKIATAIIYPLPVSASDKLHNLIYNGKFYKWLIEDAVLINVNTEEDKKYIKKQFNINTATVVHPPFKVKERHQVQNDQPGLRILFVGRITHQKGVDILIKIIESMSKNSDFSSFNFKIVGNGEKNYINKINNLSIKYKNVHYLNYIDTSAVDAQYDWADVVVIPSRYETLSRVAAETAAAGKIVISSNIPGPREIIVNDITGFLLPLSADTFVAKLYELAVMKKTSSKKFYSIGLDAQLKILNEFNPHVIYAELYRSFLLSSLSTKGHRND